jgi:hypothetical protein
MPFQYSVAHSFVTRSIRAHAPATSGVYGISNGREWLYIGTSENIQATLLEYSAKGNATLAGRAATGFSFERCYSNDCGTRQQRLIQEYRPICNA